MYYSNFLFNFDHFLKNIMTYIYIPISKLKHYHEIFHSRLNQLGIVYIDAFYINMVKASKV